VASVANVESHPTARSRTPRPFRNDTDRGKLWPNYRDNPLFGDNRHSNELLTIVVKKDKFGWLFGAQQDLRTTTSIDNDVEDC
jgi:hypothetical protein